MRVLGRKALFWIAIGLFVAGCTPSKSQPEFLAVFYDMSDERFSVQAIAPPAVVREYAICKAVWFAEKRNTRTLSMSNPVYDGKLVGVSPAAVPDGWSVLHATAYLTPGNPNENPVVNVAEYAAGCRQMWDWYR